MTSAARPTLDKNGVPNWFNDWRTSYVAGEMFCTIIYGDLGGHAMLGVPQRQYLVDALASKPRIVIRYDRARGITFPVDEQARDAEGRKVPTKAHRTEVLRLLGQAGPQAPATPQNALTGALANLGPSQANNQDPIAQASSQGPRQALALIEKLVRTPEAAGTLAVVIDYGDLLLPANQKGVMDENSRTLLAMLLTWASDEDMADNDNPVFLLSGNLTDLHADVRASTSGWKAIEIPLPDRAARLTYIRAYLEKRAGEGAPIPTEVNAEELANTTAGLNLRQIEDVLLLGAKAGSLTREIVKGRKDDIIRTENAEVAEMVEPLPGGFAALGGMDSVVDYFKAEVVGPVRAGRLNEVPKGVLFVGPPGTGKTYTVRALAQEIGFNAVSLQMSKILGGIVGQSERQMAQFFSFVKALAPCLVFVDEIDQSEMAARGNNSGNPVAKNLFSAMLQFMSDETNRGKVIMVFASNRPDLLDPALLRFGRMDAIIPILLPEEPARVQIVGAQARTQGVKLANGVAEFVAAKTDNYSSADLGAIVTKAKKLAGRQGRTEITQADADRALALILPASPQTADYYTMLAVSACNDAEFLPAKWGRMLQDRPTLEAKIEESTPASLGGPRGRKARDW